MLPIQIINLKSRAERKAFVLNEFAGKNEFEITIAFVNVPTLLQPGKSKERTIG